MREKLTVLAIALLAAVAGAQNRVDYLNGVPYAFPASQGAASTALTDDGAGNLSWSTPPSPEGLWSGCIVLSTVACPAGWTRVSSADARELRGAAAFGGSGGADTHTHASFAGVTASASSSLTGSTGSTGFSVSGSTGTASASHFHGTSTSTGSAANPTGGGTTMVVVSMTGTSIANPSHSHGVGSLSGNSHTHGAGSLAVSAHGHAPGTLAVASASNVPAYYQLIACQRD